MKRNTHTRANRTQHRQLEDRVARQDDGHIPGVGLTVYSIEAGEGLQISAPAYGRLFDEVINDRNLNISRRRWAQYDTSAGSVVVRKSIGSGGRGAIETTTQEYIELTGGSIPSPVLTGTNISQVIERIDDKNAKKTTISLSSLATLTSTDKLGALYGAETTIVESYVSAGDPWPTLDRFTVRATRQAQDDGRIKQIIETVVSWPTITAEEEDPETEQTVTTTYTVVDPGTSIGSITRRQVESVKEIDRLKSLKVVREIASGVTSVETHEFKLIDFYYPAVVDGFTSPPFSDVYFPVFNVEKASARNTKQWAHYITTYHTSNPLLATYPTYPTLPFQFFPVDISFQTPIGSNNYRSVLANGAVVEIFFTFGDPPSTTLVGVSFPIKESEPSVDEYETLVDDETEVTIGIIVDKWNYNLWRKTEIKTVLIDQSNPLGSGITVDY